MNVANIKYCDIANGVGVRTSLFVSGCRHHCPNCFNAEAWDFNYGTAYDEETEKKILDSLAPGYVEGLSLLGGEPFEPENQPVLLTLLKKAKALYPNKKVWCYSGFTLDELLGESRGRCEVTDELLSLIDVLVDGRFEEKLKNISLQFRGSENQRLIDLKKTFAEGEVVLWKSNDPYMASGYDRDRELERRR